MSEESELIAAELMLLGAISQLPENDRNEIDTIVEELTEVCKFHSDDMVVMAFAKAQFMILKDVPSR